MNKYIVTLELLSDTPPDWIVRAIEEQLEGAELLKYFDYTISEEDIKCTV